MVLLIKNKLASFEDFAHLSNLAGEAHGKQPARLVGQNLWNAGVPKAKSMPHINLLTEGGSLRAHCSAVLNTDFQGLKPGKLFARRVKSAKDDLKHLFNHASRQRRVEPAGGVIHSISMELACSTAASDVSMTRSVDPPSSPTFAIPALSDDEDGDYLHSLTAAAHGWLDFKRLIRRHCALSDPTIEEARHDFCEALIQSFPNHLSCAPSLHASLSSEYPIDPTQLHSASPISPLTSLGSVAGDKFPGFSDEELKREFDSFSFHSSQEEDWTSEVESRKQNDFNRILSGMKRELAIPIPKLSLYFSDDSLADSAAHPVPINSQTPCSAVSSDISDESSIYSADEEDELDDGEESVAVSPPGSPDIAATSTPSAAEPLLLDAPPKKDITTPSIVHVEDETDDVWKALAMHVPRLLSCISEESLVDEYKIEATGQTPPLSFRRPISEFRKRLRSGPQCTSLPDCMNSKPVAPELSNTEPSDAETSFGTTATTDTSSEVSYQNIRSLRRVRKFADLKNPVVLPTMDSTSSTETLCDMNSLHDEACFSEPQLRRLWRAPGYLDLRKAFSETKHIQTPASLHGRHSFADSLSFGNAHSFKNAHSLEDTHPLQNLHSFPNLKRRRISEDRYPVVEKDTNQPIPCDILPSKPVLPPKPPSLLLRRKRSQPSPVTTQEAPSLCLPCDLASSLPLRSCAKITQSKGRQGRAPNVSTKALRKRLDAICIKPETVHGHSPVRWQKIPSIDEIGKGKVLAKLWKTRRFK